MEMKTETWIAPHKWEGERIDKYLKESFPNMSRSYLQKLIKEHHLLVNKEKIKANYRLTGGEQIELTIPDPIEPCLFPENISLSILYEDEDILIVNKPKGMVVHPAPGHEKGTLVNALLEYCKEDLSGINGVLRPGIVHRIDRDTTGSIIICKNDAAHHEIARQLKEHTIVRKYRAIVHGVIKEEEGTIRSSIGRHPTERKKMAMNVKNGKLAITHYKVLQRFCQFTYIECKLETGRTHQIRVHMAGMGHPLLGDHVYSHRNSPYTSLKGQTLHAMTIGVFHPSNGKYIEIEAPLPDYFQHLLEIIP